MVVGRPSSMMQNAPGRSIGFDLGAIGKSVGSWFGEKAVPWLRNVAAPAALNLIDPSLGATYTNAVDGIDQGKDWTDIVGGVADDLTNNVGQKAATAIGFGPQYAVAKQGVDKVKDITGATTTGVLKGFQSLDGQGYGRKRQKM